MKIFLNDYEITIDHLNTKSHTSIVTISKNNHTIKFFVALTIGNYIENTEYYPLQVTYQDYSSKKYNNKRDKILDKDILISRFIDKAIRPALLPFLSYEINLSIKLLSYDSLIDNKFAATLATICFLKTKINIDCKIYHSHETYIVCNHEYIFAIEHENLIVDLYIRIKALIKEANKLNLEDIISENLIKSHNKKNTIKKYTRDNRTSKDIRPISFHKITENNYIFSRGLTSVMNIVTIGDTDEKVITQYNFPGYSCNSIQSKGLTRREIGHGDLIKKSFSHLDNNLKLLCEAISADGSTSMASVSGSSAALYSMNLIDSNNIVAGISIGEINKKLHVDLDANEDQLSNFDFKITASKKYIHAIHMDSKTGLRIDTLEEVIKLGLQSSLKIIKKIETDCKPSKNIKFIKINTKKIGIMIGQKGDNLKEIEKHSKAQIKVYQNGLVCITGSSENIEFASEFVNFYGFDKSAVKSNIAFFAKETKESNTINTQQGLFHLPKTILYKKDQLIRCKLLSNNKLKIL